MDWDDDIFDDLIEEGRGKTLSFELSADDLLALEQLVGSGDYALEIRDLSTLDPSLGDEIRGQRFETFTDALNFIRDGGLMGFSGILYDEETDTWGYYISYKDNE